MYTIIDATSAESISELDSLVARIPEFSLDCAEAIAIKVLPDLYSAMRARKNREILAAILARAGPASTYVVGFNPRLHVHFVAKLVASGGSVRIQKTSFGLVSDIRRQDIDRLLDLSGDLPAHVSGKGAFLAPSGRKCSSFFRVANLLHSEQSVDTLAFWTLPALSQFSVILLDSWTISPIAFRGLQMISAVKPVRAFASHPYSDRPRAAKVVRNMTQRLRSDQNVICITSITSSGKLKAEVERLFQAETRGEVVPQFMNIFATPPPGDGTVTLHEIPELLASDEVAAPAFTTRIDPSLYYPRQSPETPVPLRAQHFAWSNRPGSNSGPSEDPKSLLNEYANTSGVLRVHYKYEGRCYPQFLEVSGLVKSENFRGRVAKCLNELAAMSDGSAGDAWILVAANGPSSIAFAGMVSEILATSFATVEEIYENPRLVTGRRFLVLKEAISTGQSIESFYRGLRAAHASPKRIDYLVAIGVGTRKRMSFVSKHLTVGECDCTVRYVDCLGVSTDLPCPWCEELRMCEALVDGISIYAEIPQWLNTRLMELNASITDSTAFWCPLGGDIPRVEPGSPYFTQDWGALASIFRVATAIHGLREDPDDSNRLSPGYYRSQVLSAKCVENFSEHLLRASLIRTVGVGDWGIDQSSELERFLLDSLGESNGSYFLGECAIAIRRGLFLPGQASKLRDKVVDGLASLPGSGDLERIIRGEL